MSLEIAVQERPDRVSDDRLAEILAAPGFGTRMSDHMLRLEWTPDEGWHDAVISAYGPLSLDPATAVLHYAQEIFEGMKAYRHQDGSIWTFRPEANGERLQRSARRLALPELPVDDFVQTVDELVRVDQRWVPDGAGEKSLYIRPFMFASESFLGVRPAQRITYMVILSPAGAYFSKGPVPITLWLTEEYTRAGRGGMGAAKTGGNYASSLVAQQEAMAHGCDQVVFLDVQEGRYVEELGGMNLYFVHRDGRVVTPALGTILEGITRGSIITLLRDMGHGGGGAALRHRRVARRRPLRRDHGGLRLRHRRRGHPGGVAEVGRRRDPRGHRGRRADDGGPQGAGRRAVRPRRGPLRLDAPRLLTPRTVMRFPVTW